MQYGARVHLDDSATGRWLVYTSASTYLIDMDARHVTRCAGQVPEWPAAVLRRDGDTIPLLQVLETVTSARPMRLVLDVRGDGVVTVRETTPVTAFYQVGVDT